ncbi:MAG: 50S ribosomal protein L25 [Candidatus Paceibacterota bacterium]|jgi:large subunit ribosomal protein L25
MFTLNAKARTNKDNLATLRKAEEMPAVFYGAGKESTMISVSSRDFKKVWKEAGESSTITITTPEGRIETLIHEVQVNPITGAPIHADFLVIDTNKPIEITVPLEFEGEAPAVKNGLGNLVKVLHEIDIEALPKDLPHSIMVDLSKLISLEDQILVSDLALPKGVTAKTDGEDVIATMATIKEEVEEASAPTDLSSIEVEKRGKKEEEAEPAAE